MKKKNITIYEGGERLYITPIKAESTNQFLPFLTETGRIDNNDYTKGGFYYDYYWTNLSIFGKLRAYLRKIVFVCKYCYRTNSFNLDYFLTVWYLTIFVYCTMIFDKNRISTKYQLAVNDPDRWSDTYYLTPSQKYLRHQYMKSRDNDRMNKVNDSIKFVSEIDT